MTTRGKIVLWVTAIFIAALFTYATRDVCYVGGVKNLGYGSCLTMIDTQVNP